MHKIKIIAHSGQGFFKICMSILPENYLSYLNLEDEPFFDEISNKPVKRRKLYSKGSTTAAENKLTSVKRLILSESTRLSETNPIKT